MNTMYAVTFKGRNGFRGVTQYVWGHDALDAIDVARDVMFEDGHATPYLAPIARPAVYGEWECDSRHFTNDGGHVHPTARVWTVVL
jgi:hypothetical protein